MCTYPLDRYTVIVADLLPGTIYYGWVRATAQSPLGNVVGGYNNLDAYTLSGRMLTSCTLLVYEYGYSNTTDSTEHADII